MKKGKERGEGVWLGTVSGLGPQTGTLDDFIGR
jgi:hypothetical protein